MSDKEDRTTSLIHELDRLQEELRAARKSLDSTQYDFNEQFLTTMLSGTLSESLRQMDFEDTLQSKRNAKLSQFEQRLSNESSLSKTNSQVVEWSRSEPFTSYIQSTQEESTPVENPDFDTTDEDSNVQRTKEPVSKIPEPEYPASQIKIINQQDLGKNSNNMDLKSREKESHNISPNEAKDLSTIYPSSLRRDLTSTLGILEELNFAVKAACAESNELFEISSITNPGQNCPSQKCLSYKRLLELLRHRRYDTEKHFGALTAVIDDLILEFSESDFKLTIDSPKIFQKLNTLAKQLDEMISDLTQKSSREQRLPTTPTGAIIRPINLVPKRTQSMTSLDSVLNDLSQYLSTKKTPKERWISSVRKIKQLRLLGGTRWKAPCYSSTLWDQSQTKMEIRSNLEIFLYGLQPKDGIAQRTRTN